MAAAQASAAAAQPEVWRWETSDDAVAAYGVLLATLLAGAQPVAATWVWADLPYFLALAATTIYIGAHRSLNARQQHINLKEGLLAPIAASVVLFSAYLLIRFLPDLNLKAILDGYFWVLASVAVGGGLAGPARTLGHKLGLPTWAVDLPPGLATDEAGRPLTRGELALTDLLTVAAGVGVATADLFAHHLNFSLNNLIACMVAADILQLVGLRSFRVAGALLLGMLTYDAFWVFASPSAVGENVMLQVATSDLVSGPTRLLFPRPPSSIGEASSFPFSLLGLGDVAIPGLLACLTLRYDASRVVDLPARGAAAIEAIYAAMQELAEAEPGASGRRMGDVARDAAHAAYDVIADRENEQRDRTLGASASGGATTVYHASPMVLLHRTYFAPVLTAYVCGLLLAFAANAVTHLGQPALVYLTPCTLGAVGLVATSRGELGRIWRYTDTTPEQPGPPDSHAVPAAAAGGDVGGGDAAAGTQQQQQSQRRDES